MALVVKDRVKETTSTTGTGTLTLGGAVTGFQTFTSVLSNSDTTYYAIFESSTGQFEVGLGTFTSSGTTLARTTILESSNSGNAINLTAGAADVFITQPAEKAVYLDSSGHIAAADGRNVTNVAASTAGTVTTAAQTNITSLGTLTTLTLSGNADFNGDLDVDGTTNLDATNVVGTLAVTGSATISNASGDTLTLAKDTTEPSFRIEGDSNKDFVLTISGELLTITQNDGVTDIVTFDHDTKASSFFGDVDITSGTNAKLTINDAIGEVGSGNLAFQAQNSAGSSLKPMGFRAEDIRFATGSAERVRINDTGVGIGVTPTDSFNFGHTLDIGSTTGGFVYIRDTDATNGIGGIGYSGTRLYVVNKAAGPMTFHVNSDANERMRIASDGSVGINQTSPSQKLDVDGNIAVTGTVDGIDISGNINQAVKTTSSPQFANVYINDKIFHHADSDTYIELVTNQINLYAGGAQAFLDVHGFTVTDGSLREDYDALSGTSVTCDANSGGMFSLSMSGNTTFTFSSVASGVSVGFILQLTGNGSTVTWPGSVKWAGGSAPDAPANGETDILVFVTRDGGTNWYGVLSIDAAA